MKLLILAFATLNPPEPVRTTPGPQGLLHFEVAPEQSVSWYFSGLGPHSAEVVVTDLHSAEVVYQASTDSPTRAHHVQVPKGAAPRRFQAEIVGSALPCGEQVFPDRVALSFAPHPAGDCEEAVFTLITLP